MTQQTIIWIQNQNTGVTLTQNNITFGLSHNLLSASDKPPQPWRRQSLVSQQGQSMTETMALSHFARSWGAEATFLLGSGGASAAETRIIVSVTAPPSTNLMIGIASSQIIMRINITSSKPASREKLKQEALSMVDPATMVVLSRAEGVMSRAL
jgi:hypothetical protein